MILSEEVSTAARPVLNVSNAGMIIWVNVAYGFDPSVWAASAVLLASGSCENVERRTPPLRFALSQPCDAMFL